LESWFFHLEKLSLSEEFTLETSRKEAILECVPILELIVSSTEPSVSALEEVDGRMVPVFSESEFNDTQKEVMEHVHTAALRFVEDLLRLLPGEEKENDLRSYLHAVLQRYLSYPEKKEASVFADFLFWEDSVGVGTPRSICKVPRVEEEIVDSEKLRDAYRRCFWKKGFRAQIPREINDSWPHLISW
jgi:hypothetical protein